MYKVVFLFYRLCRENGEMRMKERHEPVYTRLYIYTYTLALSLSLHLFQVHSNSTFIQEQLFNKTKNSFRLAQCVYVLIFTFQLVKSVLLLYSTTVFFSPFSLFKDRMASLRLNLQISCLFLQ